MYCVLPMVGTALGAALDWAKCHSLWSRNVELGMGIFMPATRPGLVGWWLPGSEPGAALAQLQ